MLWKPRTGFKRREYSDVSETEQIKLDINEKNAKLIGEFGDHF